METNLFFLIGIGVLIGVVIIIIITLITFRKKKPKVLPVEQQRVENAKKFKIRSVINDGINAMMEQDYKRAIYNFNFAKNLYGTLINKDLGIEQGLNELYAMIPKRNVK